MNILKSKINFFLLIVLFSSVSMAQMVQKSILSEEFLASLPPGERSQLEGNNPAQEEEDLEKLLRSDTSVEKNEAVLERLKKELDELESKMASSRRNETRNLENLNRFGKEFFRSIQSSFMPINLPNLSTDYIVDVGDVFELMLTGKLSENHKLVVQRDGTVIIPDFGKVSVAGKTVAQAEQIVSAFIQRTQIGVSNYLSLKELRDVQILLVGAIDLPGIYTVSGNSSVLHVLNVAGGISENGSYRKIEHRRQGNLIETIDLYDILIFGKFTYKANLKSGDTIHVLPASFTIPVTGGVGRQAIYEMLPNENLHDLIQFAGGFSAGFHGYQDVLVNRVGINNQSVLKVNIDGLKTLQLEPRDSVIVPSYLNVAENIKYVTLEGMVYRPGKYFVDDNTTLGDLIRRAGGYKEGAYPYGAGLFRQDAMNKEMIFAERNYSDTVNYIVSNIGQPNSNINSDALSLLIEELKAKRYTGRIITEFNLNNLTENPGKDVRLQHSDRIIVPPIQKVVYLFGDFKNPAILNYDPEFSINNYLELAGGINDSAFDDIIIIDPDGKSSSYNTSYNFFKYGSPTIYPGSIIYAPRQVGQLSGVLYASTVAPVLSSLAISLASLNSIKD